MRFFYILFLLLGVNSNPVVWDDLEIRNLQILNQRFIQEIIQLRQQIQTCKTILEHEFETPLSRFIKEQDSALEGITDHPVSYSSQK